MANFEKCIFEILGKLGTSQLTALCNFIDSKVATLDQSLNKALAFTNVFQDQFNEVEEKLRAGENAFEDAVRNSPLLGIARELSPNCGNLADVFQGALDIAEVTKTSINDAEMVARQILTVNGLIQTLKNEAENAISALKDLCRIVQLVILENTGDLSRFVSPSVKPFTTLLPKG
jgi:phage regulator Rha-like protein